MKKTLLFLAALTLSLHCLAQEQLSFPFQGGKDIMTRFFKDSLTVSPEIIQKKASGSVIFKFTADLQGRISKIIIYYADDPILAGPAIEALKRSNHKWIIPDHEKFHDFIIPFSFSFNIPVAETRGLQAAVYDYYRNRKPVITENQVPLDMATLLPTVTVKYNITR
ncbi:MAG: hypothetical protein JWP94_3088 [Mucilaginibacter sp.]|nr:hypothetical protein [Mucilaginibacter sp.]